MKYKNAQSVGHFFVYHSQKKTFISSILKCISTKILSDEIVFSTVLLIEAKGDYIQIQVENDKPLLVHSTLKKIEEKLPKELF